jgi:ribosomal protein S27E
MISKEKLVRCPICGRDDKVYSEPETGTMECKVCSNVWKQYSKERK